MDGRDEPGHDGCFDLHDLTRNSARQTPWVRLQARTAPRASGGARHHGVRARCRRRRRPPGPLVLPKHDDEFFGVLRHRSARCTGNLAARFHLECDRYDRPAYRRGRCTALLDERRDASLVRSSAGVAGLRGSVFSHRCDLADRHALSRRWRPRRRSVFRRGQCNHDGWLAATGIGYFLGGFLSILPGTDSTW